MAKIAKKINVWKEARERILGKGREGNTNANSRAGAIPSKSRDRGKDEHGRVLLVCAGIKGKGPASLWVKMSKW